MFNIFKDTTSTQKLLFTLKTHLFNCEGSTCNLMVTTKIIVV